MASDQKLVAPIAISGRISGIDGYGFRKPFDGSLGIIFSHVHIADIIGSRVELWVNLEGSGIGGDGAIQVAGTQCLLAGLHGLIGFGIFGKLSGRQVRHAQLG